MPLSLSAAALLEMHKIAGDTVWVILVEVAVPTTPATTIRLCNNNSDITWDGETWVAFPFEIDSVDETGKGEIPSATLRVSNVTQEIQSIIEDVSGGADMPVTLRVVNSGHLDEASPELQLDFIVAGCKYDAYWITFTLGGDAKLTRRVPERRHLKDFCPFQYGGVECGIASTTMTVYPGCLKTLAQCRERGNSTRFGGEPGMPLGGFYASV